MTALRRAVTTKGASGLAIALALVVFFASTAGALVLLGIDLDLTPASNPPSISISSPQQGDALNGNGWGARCAGGGICGSATDRNGVAVVSVAVLRQATGRYWDGSGFTSAAAVYHTASGTGSWRLGLSLPPDGTYVAQIRATDGVGNQTPVNKPVTVTFTIDTVPPAPPVIEGHPDLLTGLVDAVFRLSLEAGGSLRCQLDGATTTSCDPTSRFAHLKVGDHCLRAYALDGALNASATVVFCWTVLTGAFTVSGSTAQPHHPGLTQPVDLVIDNPFLFPLQVTMVTVTIQDDTTKDGLFNPGCVGSQHLRVGQPLQGNVEVPARSTRSLSQLGIPVERWPTIEMLNLPTNQDACKGTTFRLSYAGLGRQHL